MSLVRSPNEIPLWLEPQSIRGSRLESLAKMPWIEAAVAGVLGLILLILGKTDLAQFSWILGVALSFTRYGFVKKLEEEMDPVRKMAAVIDLRRRLSTEQFQQMLSLYLEITEPEFQRVKRGIITDALQRLDQLAHRKTSEELATGEYFNWLFPTLQDTRPGSQIWAVSMMLSIEWIESEAEDTFLELNLDAARRGVRVERIIVIRRGAIPHLEKNKYIRAQHEYRGSGLTLLVVDREYLEQHDPTLLRQLGDGLIAVDSRVALVDIASPSGYRGRVTMNPGEIAHLRSSYDNLRVHARPLAKALQASQGSQIADISQNKEIPPPGEREGDVSKDRQ